MLDEVEVRRISGQGNCSTSSSLGNSWKRRARCTALLLSCWNPKFLPKRLLCIWKHFRLQSTPVGVGVAASLQDDKVGSTPVADAPPPPIPNTHSTLSLGRNRQDTVFIEPLSLLTTNTKSSIGTMTMKRRIS